MLLLTEWRFIHWVYVLSLHSDFPRSAHTQTGAWNQCPNPWLFLVHPFLKLMCPRKHQLLRPLEVSPFSPCCPHSSAYLLQRCANIHLRSSVSALSDIFFSLVFTPMVVYDFTRYCFLLSNFVGQFFLTENAVFNHSVMSNSLRPHGL